MPHHTDCECVTCKSTQHSDTLQAYANTFLAASHAADASLEARMIKANIRPEKMVKLSQCTFATCAHFGHQLAAEPELLSMQHSSPCSRAPARPETDPPVDEFNRPIDMAFMADENIDTSSPAHSGMDPPAFITRGSITYKRNGALNYRLGLYHFCL